VTHTLNMRTATRRSLGAVVVALTCALTLLIGQTSAWADTTSYGSNNGELKVEPYTAGGSPATFTDGPSNLDSIDATVPGTVWVDGADYLGTAGDPPFTGGSGIYIVYGPKESTYRTNSGWYKAGAQWVPSSLLGSGTFSNRTIEIDDQYTGTPVHGDPPSNIDCRYHWDLSPTHADNVGKYKCYIHTFAAHGVVPSPADQDEVLIEVHWT